MGIIARQGKKSLKLNIRRPLFRSCPPLGPVPSSPYLKRRYSSSPPATSSSKFLAILNTYDTSTMILVIVLSQKFTGEPCLIIDLAATMAAAALIPHPAPAATTAASFREQAAGGGMRTTIAMSATEMGHILERRRDERLDRADSVMALAGAPQPAVFLATLPRPRGGSPVRFATEIGDADIVLGVVSTPRRAASRATGPVRESRIV
jgi:hypothetical protein